MSMKIFKVDPKCEWCFKKVATCFVFSKKESKREKSYFVCDACQNKDNPYWIGFDSFFNPPGMVDWFAHLEEKGWVDYEDFFKMMVRFREATDSYGN